MNGGITSTTIADSTHPVTDIQLNSLNPAREKTDVNNNENLNNVINNQNNLHQSQTSKNVNGLNIDTGIITEENGVVAEKEEDKDSAVCDVEDYVFGLGDELVDARSDFRTDRHSPHSKTYDTKEEFLFDRTSSVDSSQKNDTEKPQILKEDVPSDCSIISSSSHGRNNKKSELVVVDSGIGNTNFNTVIRCESDRSLASFFTQVTQMSQEKQDLETINSLLDPHDTYSLVSESEYSIATESMLSRDRLDELETRRVEHLGAYSNGNSPISSQESAPKLRNDWKETLWNKSTQLGFYIPQEHR